ncbi:MAG TPA: cytochrome c [Stellaceae bacterium]|jgi:Cytochrome C'|nr:cytochrome c [Stellaceae bacterium]
MKRHFRFLLPLVALVLSAAIRDATAQQKPYTPSLGDLAVREGNWPYAAYELHELQQALDRATEAWPKWRDFSIAEMMPAVTKEAMAALDQATKASDPSRVTAAYEQLTAACNTCHRSADRGVIVIQSPTSSSFPDRDFRPVKQ